MTLVISEAVRLLEQTPRVLRSMLEHVPERFLHGTYGPNTFAPFDVVGHLLTGERTDWIVRLRLILEKGTSEAFPKYDRYAHFEVSAGRTIGELLDAFDQLRAANLAALAAANLVPGDLVRRGRHPALGEVSLENLLATWVAHDLNHIAQIARAMAWQYEAAVGPWKQYLGILNLPRTEMDADGIRRKAASAGQEPGRA